MKTLFETLFGNRAVRRMEVGKVYNFYLRNFDPNTGEIMARGGVAVAIELDSAFNATAAVAVCSANDNFWRKKGRELAQARLKAKDARFSRVYSIDEHMADIQSEQVALEDIAMKIALDVRECQAAMLVDVQEVCTEYNLFPQ